MKTLTTFILSSALIISNAFAAEGMINVPSEFSVKETADRFEQMLAKKGMTQFARIAHSTGAAKVGIDLHDTTLIIFGNPKVGSPLMQCEQTVAIDLPQKALIWQDDQNTVWISYNDPGFLQQRHAIQGCEPVLAKIQKALAGMTRAAAQK